MYMMYESSRTLLTRYLVVTTKLFSIAILLGTLSFFYCLYYLAMFVIQNTIRKVKRKRRKNERRRNKLRFR